MNTHALQLALHLSEVLPGANPSERARRRIAQSALFGAGYIYLLILFGAFVRLSGSGLGCGDHWPYCNGSWFPAWDVTTWIEWGHRLLGAAALIPFGLVVGSIYSGRNTAGSDAPFFIRLAKWIIGLLVIQALLGALTVKLDLSAPVTAIHFVIANLILALFLVIALRARSNPVRFARLAARRAFLAAVLALLALGWGALTANSGASLACLGFPLCNGTAFPLGPTSHATALLHIHWAHRLLAYTLFGYVMLNAIRAMRAQVSVGVKRASCAALLLVCTEVAIGVGLVEFLLPITLRGLHVVVGVALFAALVIWWQLAGEAWHEHA